MMSGALWHLPTLSYFLFTNILSPPYLHSFHSIKRKQSWAICPPHFWQGELIVQICILLHMHLGAKKDFKIRIVPLFILFLFRTLKTHQKLAATGGIGESGWRPAHGLSHCMGPPLNGPAQWVEPSDGPPSSFNLILRLTHNTSNTTQSWVFLNFEDKKEG